MSAIKSVFTMKWIHYEIIKTESILNFERVKLKKYEKSKRVL